MFRDRPLGSGRVGALVAFALLPGAWCCSGDGGDPLLPQDTIPSPIPCYFPDDRCRERVPVGDGFLLPLFRTHPLLAGDTTVTRAVVVVHGANRNPDDYFETMLDAVSWAAAWEGTLVVAPHFQTQSDGPGPDEAAWTVNGWKRGDESYRRPGFTPTVSSYGALDEVLRFLGDRENFPKLESVVVTGHSAGGQYAHRYAATSPVENELRHLRFRYVVANPSTYLYIGPERRLSEGGFGLPDRQDCPDYNEWHYGFEKRNPYALRLSEEGIRTRLLERDVVYMVGTADTGDSMLDMSCGAMLQGRHRYARGLNLFAYLKAFFPGNGHALYQVSGVGHSSRGIYQSQEGREALFQW